MSPFLLVNHLFCTVKLTVETSVVVTWSRSNGPQLTARHRTLTNGSFVIEKASLADQSTYICTARNFLASLNFRVGVNIYFPNSCSEIKRAGFSERKMYLISPKGLTPFAVHRDMRDKNGIGVTVISHDSEARTLVSGFENPGT